MCNNELTIEDCDFNIELKQYMLDYNEYMVKILNQRVDTLNNENKMKIIDVKVLIFAQKNNFKMDIDLNNYKETINHIIDANDKIIADNILEKTLFQKDIDIIKTEIRFLNQMKGFLISTTNKTIKNK